MSNCFICISAPCETVILPRPGILFSSPPPHTPTGRALHFYIFLERKNASNPKKERRHIQIKTDTCRDSFYFFTILLASAIQTREIFILADAGASHSLLIILEIQETGTEKNDKMFRIYIFFPPFFLSFHLPHRNYMSVIFYSRLFFYDLPSAVLCTWSSLAIAYNMPKVYTTAHSHTQKSVSRLTIFMSEDKLFSSYGAHDE